jgi:hypothetical protein
MKSANEHRLVTDASAFGEGARAMTSTGEICFACTMGAIFGSALTAMIVPTFVLGGCR